MVGECLIRRGCCSTGGTPLGGRGAWRCASEAACEVAGEIVFSGCSLRSPAWCVSPPSTRGRTALLLVLLGFRCRFNELCRLTLVSLRCAGWEDRLPW